LSLLIAERRTGLLDADCFFTSRQFPSLTLHDLQAIALPGGGISQMGKTVLYWNHYTIITAESFFGFLDFLGGRTVDCSA